MRLKRPTRPTYTSCDNLPLANFIEIVCTGELKHLYSEPAKYIHKQADLNAIWQVIFNEYNELTNNAQAKHIFNLVRDMYVLQTRISIIDDTIALLASVDDVNDYTDAIGILHQYGCGHIQITNSDKIAQLKRCVSICRKFVLELKQKETEYNALNTDTGAKVTKQDYYANVAVISKYMNGKDIDLHKTTVSLYISYINLMKANNEANGK